MEVGDGRVTAEEQEQLMENNTMKGICETGFPISWRNGKSVRPCEGWFRKHGLPTFHELLELPVGVGARARCQPTVELAQSVAQPLGNLFTGLLAATMPSSAFSLAQSGQEFGKFGRGTVVPLLLQLWVRVRCLGTRALPRVGGLYWLPPQRLRLPANMDCRRPRTLRRSSQVLWVRDRDLWCNGRRLIRWCVRCLRL